MLEHDMDFGQV